MSAPGTEMRIKFPMIDSSLTGTERRDAGTWGLGPIDLNGRQAGGALSGRSCLLLADRQSFRAQVLSSSIGQFGGGLLAPKCLPETFLGR